MFLPIASCGATESAIIAASLAKGTSVIINPYLTPEIFDFIEFLNKMGVGITIFNKKILIINGVKKLNGTVHNVIPDNIEAITYIIAATITEGKVTIKNFPFNPLESILYKLQKIGLVISQVNNDLKAEVGEFRPFKICADNYPSIYSDMQPIFSLLALKSKGESVIKDHRWPNRFQYIYELNKMGANIALRNGCIHINGKQSLYGHPTEPRDIRCAITLLLAGFISEGTTIINNIWQAQRGYNNLFKKLIAINGNIHLC